MPVAADLVGSLVDGLVDNVLVGGLVDCFVDGLVGGHVDGLVGGHVGGLVDCFVDGLVGGHVDGLVGGHVDGLVGGLVDCFVDGLVGGLVDGHVDGLVGGLVGGHADGLVGGHVDGHADQWEKAGWVSSHLAGKLVVEERLGSSCRGLEGWENCCGGLAEAVSQNHFAADVELEDGGKEVAFPRGEVHLAVSVVVPVGLGSWNVGLQKNPPVVGLVPLSLLRLLYLVEVGIVLVLQVLLLLFELAEVWTDLQY